MLHDMRLGKDDSSLFSAMAMLGQCCNHSKQGRNKAVNAVIKALKIAVTNRLAEHHLNAALLKKWRSGHLLRLPFTEMCHGNVQSEWDAFRQNRDGERGIVPGALEVSFE